MKNINGTFYRTETSAELSERKCLDGQFLCSSAAKCYFLSRPTKNEFAQLCDGSVI